MTIIQGDCLEVMRSMADNSIDFIVTDPPYGLHFMGKHWDGQIPQMEIWAEALRVAKPGSMLAAFGGSRTHHHLMCAIEGAGWEIRDVIMWIYGSGFPKSHNHFGFKGYGTALKPAYEPIIIAMRPLDGTFAQNAEKWGVAGINIDESRIGNEKRINPSAANNPNGNSLNMSTYGMPKNIYPRECQGRWPANIIFDEEAAAELDEMTVDKIHSAGSKRNKIVESYYNASSYNLSSERQMNRFGDSGGASRFFYCAKASSTERNRGLEGRSNIHPTIKPIALMKYILKLLAPPGNPTCLDPFAGSGSTLVAAKELGINCIGIEKEKEYCDIAKARIA